MTTEAGKALLEAIQMMLEDAAHGLGRDRDARVALPLPALVRTLVPAIEAEAVAAERERIKGEAEEAACQCLDHAECAGCHEDGESLDDLSFAAVLAIVKPEADHA